MGVGGSVQDSAEEFEVILEPFPGIILLLAFQGKESQNNGTVFLAKLGGGVKGGSREKSGCAGLPLLHQDIRSTGGGSC